MQQITLYTTAGCHLCEEAEAMLLYLINQFEGLKQIQLQKIEISENDNLVDIYGLRIPVFCKEQNELAWPFTLEELHSWLIN